MPLHHRPCEGRAEAPYIYIYYIIYTIYTIYYIYNTGGVDALAPSPLRAPGAARLRLPPPFISLSLPRFVAYNIYIYIYILFYPCISSRQAASACGWSWWRRIVIYYLSILLYFILSVHFVFYPCISCYLLVINIIYINIYIILSVHFVAAGGFSLRVELVAEEAEDDVYGSGCPTRLYIIYNIIYNI